MATRVPTGIYQNYASCIILLSRINLEDISKSCYMLPLPLIVALVHYNGGGILSKALAGDKRFVTCRELSVVAG